MNKDTLLQIIESDIHGLLAMDCECGLSREQCDCVECGWCERLSIIKDGNCYCDTCEQYIDQREGK